MFSLYKNIIGGNFIVEQFEHNTNCSHQNEKEQEVWILQNCRLFSLPHIPFIDKPNCGHDTLLTPYRRIYIEELVRVSLPNANIHNVLEHRGCFLFNCNINEVDINDPFYKRNKCRKEDLPTNTRYLMIGFCYTLQDDNMAHFIQPLQLGFCITAEGDLLDSSFGNVEENEYTYHWQNWIFSFLRFINLPNITIEREPLERKSIKYFKKIRTNQTHYHILKIHKPTITHKKSKQTQTGETCRPLHQVRGHLADYTEGKGLFGKYNVRIWISDHWRGDLEYGRIGKDYSITKN